MTKTLFRALGAAHGIAGLVTLFVVVYIVSKGGVAALSPGSFKIVGVTGGAVTIIGLIGCAVTAWMRPSIAALCAWLAVLAYIITPVLQNFLQFGTSASDNLLPNFYYSAAIRVLAASVLALLWWLHRPGANYSLKRTAAG